jgi:hypothetical protein
MDFSNKWVNDTKDDTMDDESVNDSDDEYIQNEIPPPDIDANFVENTLKVKHSLYDNIVLSPELGTKDAQSPKVLHTYLKNMNQMYILALNAQKGKINEDSLSVFPKGSRESIKFTLKWIADYFSKNRAPDTIPYSDFIRKSFHEYQFVQNDNFD